MGSSGSQPPPRAPARNSGDQFPGPVRAQAVEVGHVSRRDRPPPAVARGVAEGAGGGLGVGVGRDGGGVPARAPEQPDHFHLVQHRGGDRHGQPRGGHLGNRVACPRSGPSAPAPRRRPGRRRPAPGTGGRCRGRSAGWYRPARSPWRRGEAGPAAPAGCPRPARRPAGPRRRTRRRRAPRRRGCWTPRRPGARRAPAARPAGPRCRAARRGSRWRSPRPARTGPAG